jgi:hypothetical protein
VSQLKNINFKNLSKQKNRKSKEYELNLIGKKIKGG